jgi:hypothetical protein
MDHVVPVKKNVLNCQIFIISYLHLWRESTCTQDWFNWVQSRNSGKETAQVAVHEWYHNTPKEWFCGAI